MTIDKNLLIALILGSAITAICFPFAYIMNLQFEVSTLELAAVWTSFVCTILCVTQNRINFVFGIMSTFLYSILFWEAGLLALSVFNGILVLSLFYGYWRWGPDGKPIPVTNITKNSIVGYVAFSLFIGALMTGIFRVMEAEVMQLDIAIAGISATAQLMLDNKKRQTWIVWAVVNVFSIFLFYQQALYMVMFQYMFFLGNTVVAYIQWTKTMEAKNA